ncbi:PREDICTED: NAC transcription factor ONAC010-like [Erythranthe guttata]|uniref:NAC transcription factor ONAC010-like n=1 Tax=Erythranthe guttata TaxID=4155 RepID=UPI00064D9D28|nr:PREDICTED: NAC transcription factor ONAC010-like [Erythranthe guttata]|eukprot:XP_012834175.1 PREDICTED: NAC transcription factor ONAC010-like [Erythranthe guttata]
MRIAPGFVPSDEELINCYLLKVSMGIPLPWNLMSEKEIYGETTDPWEVLQDVHWEDFHSETKFKHVTYVLTKLLRVNGMTRIARRTKSGTWKGQTSGKEIYDESSGNLIGLSKMFTFYKNKPKGRSGEEEEEHESLGCFQRKTKRKRQRSSRRLAEDKGIEEDRDACDAFSKMQKIDLDNIEFDFDIDIHIDDISLKYFGWS